MEPVPVQETDPEGAVEWMLSKLGGARKLMQDRVQESMSELIRRLTEGADAEDRLFICQSRYTGPLAGHQGLGMVRKGSVVRYKKVLSF
jgi:hypothetical protein